MNNGTGIILHCMEAEKFIEPFIEFVDQHFDSSRHRFLVSGPYGGKFKVKERSNVKLFKKKDNRLLRAIIYIASLNKAKKIILHGLFDTKLLLILFAQPWLLKKCYWVLWGADLYTYQLDKRTLAWWRWEFFRRFVIKRIGHFITHVKGDYELAQKWYGANGQWHDCFMYPSNLFQDYGVKPKAHGGINILLGNSADPSNHHIEALEKLAVYKGADIHIYAPLSYGDMTYAQAVVAHGQTVFGDKFIPLLEFMHFEQYLDLLAQIDIAVFNHRRQQAMGNITTLLGLGKKVYMRSDVTSWQTFKQLGIEVYVVTNVDLVRIGDEVARQNHALISEYFSVKNLKQQWKYIYD